MRKQLYRPVFVILLGAIALLCIAATGWSAEKFELKFACEYTDKHPTSVNAFLPWIKKMGELSQGRLMIQFYNPNTICPAKEVYASTVAGAVDIGASPTHWVPGRFAVSEVIELPFLFNGSEAGSLTTWEIYKRFAEWREEYKEVKMLWQWTSALNQLHTVKKPVRTLEDFKGLKIISWAAPINHMIRMLGANPVDGKPHDTYLALERGMADGVICPIAPMRSFKITDAAKHHTIINLAANTFWGGMNQAKWNSLPPDLQKIIEESTGDKMAQLSGQTLDEGSIQDAKWMKEQKHSFYVPSPAEKEKWKERLKPVTEEWLKKMEQKGYKNVRSIQEATASLGKQYSEKTKGGYAE
ncbi:MAG: TRAP transporter substrate-binding protein [Thermodesulfobacteriota bacterium]